MENIDISVFSEEPDVGRMNIDKTKERKRKANYSRYEETILRCKKKLANLANTCIAILESLSEKDLFHIYTERMDEADEGKKGRRSKLWYGGNSFCTPWNIRVNGEVSIRIFALAYLIDQPRNVKISRFDKDDTAYLIWQRPEEVGRLMTTYGNLMARKNRLKSSEQELLDKILKYIPEIYNYLSERS